jgi:hypothetical protein
MVMTQYGVVATLQAVASQAGAAILAKGGGAVDAAIAPNAALSVIEPMMNGVGGDLFAVLYDTKAKHLRRSCSRLSIDKTHHAFVITWPGNGFWGQRMIELSHLLR